MERRKGFTLAELLIVVAIIAVLVAVAIPIFNNQMEKAREATDIALLRQAYSAARRCESSGRFDCGREINPSVSYDFYGVYNPSTGELISLFTYNTMSDANRKATFQTAKPKARIEGWQGNKPDFDNSLISGSPSLQNYVGYPCGPKDVPKTQSEINNLCTVMVRFSTNNKVDRIMFMGKN